MGGVFHSFGIGSLNRQFEYDNEIPKHKKDEVIKNVPCVHFSEQLRVLLSHKIL